MSVQSSKSYTQIGVIVCATVAITLLASEYVLRKNNFRPGYLNGAITKVDTLIHKPLRFIDSNGIYRYYAGGEDPGINAQGFFSPYPFDSLFIDSVKTTGTKVVMLVGDSYVEGKSTGNGKEGFAWLLDNSNEMLVLNMGMGGTDPSQYEAVVKKYAAMLKPDLVAVGFFLGNDIVYANRESMPGKPVLFETNAGSLFAYPEIFAPNKEWNIRNANDAYLTYLELFSLHHAGATAGQRLCAQTAVATYLYYAVNPVMQELLKTDLPPYTPVHHSAIKRICAAQNIPLRFYAIPSVRHLENEEAFEADCAKAFNKDVEYFRLVPGQFECSDYISSDNDHFSVTGNYKAFKLLQCDILRLLNLKSTVAPGTM